MRMVVRVLVCARGHTGLLVVVAHGGMWRRIKGDHWKDSGWSAHDGEMVVERDGHRGRDELDTNLRRGRNLYWGHVRRWDQRDHRSNSHRRARDESDSSFQGSRPSRDRVDPSISPSTIATSSS